MSIPTERGILNIYQSGNKWGYSTPSGATGVESSVEEAIRAAFDAEGLNPSKYGY